MTGVNVILSVTGAAVTASMTRADVTTSMTKSGCEKKPLLWSGIACIHRTAEAAHLVIPAVLTPLNSSPRDEFRVDIASDELWVAGKVHQEVHVGGEA